jgi:hypothetical protein
VKCAKIELFPKVVQKISNVSNGKDAHFFLFPMVQEIPIPKSLKIT